MTTERSALKEWLADSTSIRSQLPSDVEIKGWLNDGGQGVVLRGEYQATPAAIKIYYPGQISQRIDREVRALRAIKSDYIVPLLWSGSISFREQRLPVVITQLVEGNSLDVRCRDRALSEQEVARLVHDVANAISALWERRIVHRDLKPENIIERKDGSYCIIDLGVARHLDEASLTVMGATWGTLGYMSPEQTRAVRQLTCKSDIFSLGVIALEAALGKHPTGRDQLRLMSRRLDRKLPEEVHHFGFANVWRSLLAPRPVQRPLPGAVAGALRDLRLWG